MNDIVNNLELITIKQVPLSESEVGKNINDRFVDIDKNFQSIITSEYLKGQTGDGIYTKECSFEKDSSVELGIYKGNQLLTSGDLYQLISDCILKEVGDSQPSDGRIPSSKIILIYQNNDGKNILKSSLPYVFIDTIYLESLKGGNEPNPNKDLSCIIYFEDDSFKKSSTIPKIYYDNNVATFCWNINGEDTQLPAQGPKGIDGKPGVSVYYAKCEHKDGNYRLTHIYEQGNFISLEGQNLDISLENGTVVMAYCEVVDSNENKVDIIVGVVNKNIDNNDYFIAESVKLNIPSILELMKKNDSNSLYVTIPGVDEKEDTKGYYHKISSIVDGTNYVLKMGAVDENNIESTINNDILVSDYSINKFNGKLIADNVENEVCASSLSTTPIFSEDGNNIKIEVGGQTSDAFEVPYAAKATELTNKPSIQADEQDGNNIKINVGEKTSDAFEVPYAAKATELTNKPSIQADGQDGNNIKINVGGQTSDLFTVPFANYSGYALNPIFIQYSGAVLDIHAINAQQNKINYIYAINKSEGDLLPSVRIFLPQPDISSYIDVKDNDENTRAQVGICQFVLYIDASISMRIMWVDPWNEIPDDDSQLTSVSYNIDNNLLEPQKDPGVKELIFTGYWKKIDKEKHVTWLVGGSTSKLTPWEFNNGSTDSPSTNL